jgi:hypothetical protein
MTDVTIVIQPVQMRLIVTYGSEPLPGAHVQFSNENRRNRRVWNPDLVTDALGEVSAEIWQNGRIYAKVQDGLIDGPVLSSHEFGSSDVTWSINVPKQRVVATVRDAVSGAAIPGAHVVHDFAASDGSSLKGLLRVADGNGTVRFSALKDGVHGFSAKAPGYYSSDRLTVVLPSTSEEQHIDILLTPGKTVHLMVSDWTGAPAAQARVIDGFANGGENPAGITLTDDGGEMLIPVRSGERHELCVVPQNGSFRLLSITEDSDESRDVTVAVPAPAGALRIQAMTVDGRPVAGLRYLLRYNGQFVAPAIPKMMAFLQGRRLGPNPTGVTVFDRLPAGQFEIWPFASELELARLQTNTPPPSGTVYLVSGQMDVQLVIGGVDRVRGK